MLATVLLFVPLHVIQVVCLGHPVTLKGVPYFLPHHPGFHVIYEHILPWIGQHIDGVLKVGCGLVIRPAEPQQCIRQASSCLAFAESVLLRPSAFGTAEYLYFDIVEKTCYHCQRWQHACL